MLPLSYIELGIIGCWLSVFRFSSCGCAAFASRLTIRANELALDLTAAAKTITIVLVVLHAVRNRYFVA